MTNGFIWPIEKTLLGATSSGKSELGSDSYDGVLRIPQSSSITGVSPSDCLVSYLGHLLEGSLNPLQWCSWCIPQLPTGLVKYVLNSVSGGFFKKSETYKYGVLKSKCPRLGDMIIFSANSHYLYRFLVYHIYQPLRSSRIWHKVNF